MVDVAQMKHYARLMLTMTHLFRTRMQSLAPWVHKKISYCDIVLSLFTHQQS